MTKGKSSGISLSNKEAAIVLGMVARGDRKHDIAAWFGVNQGRIAEVEDGEYDTGAAAPASDLPPKGPPGLKGRRLRGAVEKACDALAKGDSGTKAAVDILQAARAKYDSHEA